MGVVERLWIPGLRRVAATPGMTEFGAGAKLQPRHSRNRASDYLESMRCIRPTVPQAFPWLLLLLLGPWSTATCATPNTTSLLVLLKDSRELAVTLADLKQRYRAPGDLETRRRSLLASHLAAFAQTRRRVQHEITKLLPPRARRASTFEALPPLNAWLLHVPSPFVASAFAALTAATHVPHASLAYVARHGVDEEAPITNKWDGNCANCQPAPAPITANSTPVLAILDSGADATHPLLSAALGPFHFQNRTPGATFKSDLLRSHGSAMLGIYAQQARGDTLLANGVPVNQRAPPFPIAATLVGHAGPETRTGRTQLVRNLAWLLAPSAARPWPDLLNYSQGNGALCTNEAPTCARTPWAGVTRALDRAIEEYALVVVKSAGNRGYAEHTTMTVPGDTYNGIVVGNMHAFDWETCKPSADRLRHKVYRTSSPAPPPSGPRLLDLVAPGIRVATAGVDPAYCLSRCAEDRELTCAFCARLGTATETDTDFRKLNSGSSPAAAIVGAVAARLLNQGYREPMRIKAILINSADAWSSGGRPPPATRGDGAGCAQDPYAAAHGAYPYGAHYDRSYGWGYLNPEQAQQQAPYARTGELPAQTSQCFRTELAPWEKITLAWQRRVGSCQQCNGHDWYRLSPLSLALFEDRTGYPLLDRDVGRHAEDNVQQVSNGRGKHAQPSARVIVRVSLPAAAIDGAGSEPYALASARALTLLAACPMPQHRN